MSMSGVVKVKVCGITQLEDAQLAVDLGAWAVGFVFWTKSPRYISPVRAEEIVSRLPGDLTAIGVFVNATVDEIHETVVRVGLSHVQLHGEESSSMYHELQYPIIRSVPVSAENVSILVDRVPKNVTVLLDAHDPVQRGGTGRRLDWTVASQVAATRDVILAGGLNAKNIREAVRVVKPYGLDVSSGVEFRPGRKSDQKLRAFFEGVFRP